MIPTTEDRVAVRATHKLSGATVTIYPKPSDWRHANDEQRPLSQRSIVAQELLLAMQEEHPEVVVTALAWPDFSFEVLDHLPSRLGVTAEGNPNCHCDTVTKCPVHDPR